MKTRTLAKTGHSSGYWVVVREATADHLGQEIRYCNKCGCVLETKDIAQHTHSGSTQSLSRKQPAHSTDRQVYTISVDVYHECFEVVFGGHKYIEEEGVFGEVSFKDNLELFAFNVQTIFLISDNGLEFAEDLIPELTCFGAYLRSYIFELFFLK